jgi:hypothetical protein
VRDIYHHAMTCVYYSLALRILYRGLRLLCFLPYTKGRSEEEDEEDTSIYQAVLSPDCQDVRLKKGR